MKARRLILFSFLVFLSLSAQSHGPATITIASWNIEQFGEAKSGDPVRLSRIAKVVKEFDVIAIEEIVHAESEGQVVIDRLTAELRDEHDREYKKWQYRTQKRAGG